jgi:hypothetical protein
MKPTPEKESLSVERPVVLLASDSERFGAAMYRILNADGFRVRFAGYYGGVDRLLDRHAFDVVLLEVTHLRAVEAAVEAAIRVKRMNAAQLVAYAADSALESSGLAGDGIVPRNNLLPTALRGLLDREGLRGACTERLEPGVPSS